MKTSTTENECNKFEKSIENYTENKMKIDEIKQNIIREFTKIINTDIKETPPKNTLKITKTT